MKSYPWDGRYISKEDNKVHSFRWTKNRVLHYMKNNPQVEAYILYKWLTPYNKAEDCASDGITESQRKRIETA